MRRLTPLFVALAVTTSLSLPAAQRTSKLEDERSVLAAVDRSLSLWKVAHGDSWSLVRDHESGFASFLYGGSRDYGLRPISDADFADLARVALQETETIHGVSPSTLVLDRVVHLPLGRVGSTDKMTVRFRQELDGVPVHGGSMNVLFDTGGKLLSVDSLAIPEVTGLAFRASLPDTQAELLARSWFQLESGAPATETTAPVLKVVRTTTGKLVTPRLVWEVTAYFRAPDFPLEGTTYRLDANTGDVVQRENAVHNDVSGNVKSLATPGTGPDDAGNPAVPQNMPYVTVTSSQGSAVTDADGNFTIVGATAPVTVTVQYEGLYADTVNQGGSDYSFTTTLNAASGNDILMNASPAEYTTAEANAALWIAKMRDWTRATNPSDAISDFQATANVNINSSCNATFDGSAVNFFREAGGCVNTSFSSVVLHEMGHWLNQLYGSFNGGDGFGEGNADVFSIYVLDDPIVGRDFFGAGTQIRDAGNTRQFCGDCCGGCYGPTVHGNGEVLMGALWKVRSRLKTTLGATAGRSAADVLLNAWMNAYDDAKIKSIIELHWLTLDDDNGNIYDGTPNHGDIDGGFTDQGFPGVPLRNLTITNVTELPNTLNESGPYAVSADVVANFEGPVTGVDLRYSVNGGPFQTVAMSAGAGTSYSASIPGQLSPAKVQYYVEAADGDANTTTEPVAAPAAFYDFAVGTQQSFYLEDFESGANGWTHVTNNGNQDDWQLSSEQGLNGAAAKSGDPGSAFSGTNIWGNDLGPSGFNGAYSNDVDNSLLSPALDLSLVRGATLRFRRWLTVEWGLYDYARVLVNGTEVWINELDQGDVLDTSWQTVEIDISHLADCNPSVQLEWNLRSDGGLTYGGWNIDDVEILTVIGTPAAAFAASPTSGTVPLTVAFSDASTGGPTSWSWDFGDGSTSTQASPSHTYTTPGTYDVSLTVSGLGGSDTETKLGYVVVDPIAAPEAGFSGAPLTGVAPLAVTFADASVGDVAAWSWDFGDGSTSTQASPIHTYAAAGSYDVSLTVSGPGGSDTETKLDYVVVAEPAPEAGFTVSRRFARKAREIAFRDVSTGAVDTWLWDFGDGTTSTDQDATHAYRRSGLYTVSLTVTGPGGSDTRTKVGHILVMPGPVPATLPGSAGARSGR